MKAGEGEVFLGAGLRPAPRNTSLSPFFPVRSPTKNEVLSVISTLTTRPSPNTLVPKRRITGNYLARSRDCIHLVGWPFLRGGVWIAFLPPCEIRVLVRPLGTREQGKKGVLWGPWPGAARPRPPQDAFFPTFSFPGTGPHPAPTRGGPARTRVHERNARDGRLRHRLNGYSLAKSNQNCRVVSQKPRF